MGRGFPCSASHAVPFQKELEAAWRVQVFDRFTVVLHIFRCNARTKEARLQVALAELPLLRCWHSVRCLHSQLGLLPVFLGPTVAGAWDPQGVAGPTPWTAELVGHPMGLVPAWERHPLWDPVSRTAKGGPQPTSHLDLATPSVPPSPAPVLCGVHALLPGQASASSSIHRVTLFPRQVEPEEHGSPPRRTWRELSLHHGVR